jgi:hypothetical protein
MDKGGAAETFWERYLANTDSVGYSAKKADGQRSWERSKLPGKTRVAPFQIASGPFGPVPARTSWPWRSDHTFSSRQMVERSTP